MTGFSISPIEYYAGNRIYVVSSSDIPFSFIKMKILHVIRENSRQTSCPFHISCSFCVTNIVNVSISIYATLDVNKFLIRQW